MERAPLYILAETCLERILEEIARLKPAFVIVDSVQTVFSLKFQSAPGSIGQVREAATQLLFAAKGQNIPTFLVGHVTKDGSLAGPKALEHIVDTVLYFEGEKHHAHRLVRAVKNRFGAVERGRRVRDDGARAPRGAESLAAVPRRAPRERRPVPRSCAASRARARCSWKSRPLCQHQHLRQRAAHDERPRSEPALAAPRGPREARGTQPHRRRRVRQRRRRNQRRRTGRGSRDRRGRRVQRPQPADRGLARRSSARSGSRAKCAASRRRRSAFARPPRWVSPAASSRTAIARAEDVPSGLQLIEVKTVSEAIDHLMDW